MSSIKSGNSLRRAASKPIALASGAIDEEVFRNAFSSVSSLPIYSARDLSEYMGKIKESLSLNAEAWEKRCEALKMLRNVVSGGGPQMEEFNVLLRSLVSAVENCLRDLRSQVVREGCITVAYMSQELGNRFDYFAEMILQTLINLIPNSAKIMSTSGIAAINFIIRNTYASRLLPIIFSGLTSKSAVVRRYMCVFLEPIIQLWPENVLEKHMGTLQESLRKGLSDANQDARSATRSAFQVFARRFPASADSLLQSLDALTRKMVEKIISGDGSGNTSEASSLTNLATTSRARPGNIGTAKRTNMPALGSSGISSISSQKPINGTTSAIGRSRSKVGQFNTMRARPGKKMVSQSQPASRETSPSSRTGSEYAYVPSTGYGRLGTPKAGGYAAGVPASIGRTSDTSETDRHKGSSRLPKSQASSRDTSPNSGFAASPYRPEFYGTERPRRVSGPASGYLPVSLAMSDVGAANDSSSYYRQQDSDDNASEASSMCSSRSGRSVPSSRRLQTLRSITGFNDMVALLSSTQWAEKKDGLIHLYNHIRSEQTFTQPEVMRIAEVLSQIFRDFSSKVFSLFMETLQVFIKRYNQYLHEWIYGTLVRLFTRQARELSTHQRAIQDTLNVIRSHFPLSLQFQCCFHFIVDDAVTPSLKVKVCVLEYLKDLIVMLPVEAMNNPSQDVIKGVTRVIGWSTEPKSPDVRRLASRVVIKLSDLNPTAFASYIQQIPTNFQNQAYKLLKTYQKKTNLSGTETISPTGLTTNQVAKLPTSRPFSPVSASYIPQQAAYPPPGDSIGYARGHSSNSSVTDGYTEPRQPNYPPPHYRQQFGSQHQHYFSNPDGYNSGSVHNQFPVAGDGMFSQASNPPHPQQAAVYGQDLSYQQQQQQQVPNMSPNNNNLYQQSPPSILSGLRNEPLYTKLKKPVIGYQTLKKIREMPPEDAITEILQELSNYNQRYEQRKACMLKLIKLLRDGSIDTWSEHSKPTLLILLESLCDNSGETRALALRVLQELVRTQGDLVSEYACLTVMKILECCGDYDKAVVRAAEECAFTVARNLPQNLCLHLLTTIITDKQTTLRLPAIKMQTEVIKFSSPEAVEEELPSLIPDLVALCGHDDSHVRKASIFCLVQIAIKFGDDIWEYLKGLNASKKRLLRIYIDKERECTAFNESVPLSGNIPIH